MKVLYQQGDKLEEDQFLLKVCSHYHSNTEKGFLTKFNKDGTIPKAFLNWGGHTSKTGTWNPGNSNSIYVFDEYFRSGWEIVGYRSGASRVWCQVKHPEGFILEVYLNNLFTIISENIISNGIILGEFKWEDNKLIKKL